MYLCCIREISVTGSLSSTVPFDIRHITTFTFLVQLPLAFGSICIRSPDFVTTVNLICNLSHETPNYFSLELREAGSFT